MLKMKRPRGIMGVQTQDAYYFVENVSVAPMDSVSACICEKEGQKMRVVYRRNLSENTQLFPEKAIEHKKAFFEFQSVSISSAAGNVLNGVTQLLNDNPMVKIEIQGHAEVLEEAKMAEENLSWQRAKNVYYYLVSKGIKEDRLSYKGYKDDNPVNNDQSPTGRKQNRRVEFKIVE